MRTLIFAALFALTLAPVAARADNGKKPKNCDMAVPTEIQIPEAHFTYESENASGYSGQGYRTVATQNLISQCNLAILAKPEQERDRYSCGAVAFNINTPSWMDLIFHKAPTQQEMTDALCSKLTGCMATVVRENNPTDYITWIQNMRSAIGCSGR